MCGVLAVFASTRRRSFYGSMFLEDKVYEFSSKNTKFLKIHWREEISASFSYQRVRQNHNLPKVAQPAQPFSDSKQNLSIVSERFRHLPSGKKKGIIANITKVFTSGFEALCICSESLSRVQKHLLLNPTYLSMCQKEKGD